MRNKLAKVILLISRYKLDLLFLIGLTILNLPLLLDLPYVFNFDTTVYLSVALNFINGHGFTLPSGYPSLSSHPILFPLILAFFIKITPNVLYAVWMVKIFSILTVWTAYILGKCMFHHWVGVLIGTMITFSFLFRESSNYAYIDIIIAFCLILGLLFIWLSYKKRGVWLILSGFCMGSAFLLKESALFWVTVPWMLFFVDWRYRQNTRLIYLWIYTALVVIPVGGWMLWSYRWVGQMFPLSSNLTTFFIRWGCFALIISILLSYAFVIMNQRLVWFALLNKSIWFLRVFFIVIISANMLIGTFITLFQNLSAGISLPWVEIPAYISKYYPYLPAFGIIAGGCLIVVARAFWKGDSTSIYSALVLIIGVPWLSVVARSEMAPRQILGYVLITYLLIIGSLFWVLEWVQRTQQGRFRQVINVVCILGLISIALWYIKNQNTYYYQGKAQARQNEELPYTGWFSNLTLSPAAVWIKENIPPGTPLLSSYYATYSLFYQTDGSYPIFELPTLNVGLEPLESHQIFVPLSYSMRAAYLPLVGKKLQVLAKEIIYLSPVYTEGDLYLQVLMEKDILTWLQENRIEYVILTGDYLQREDLYLDYFTSNPGFELVWSRVVDNEMPIYILRVNYAKLNPQGQYPIIMTPTTLEEIINHSAGRITLDSLADYFPRGISLRPITRQDEELAISLALHYLKTGRFGPAYDLFKSIKVVDPEYVQQQLGIEAQGPLDTLVHCMWNFTQEQFAQAAVDCKTAKELLPELSTPRVILGEIEMAQGQPSQALIYYLAANQIRADGSTYIQLGDAYRLMGQFNNAREAYQQAVALDPTNQIAQSDLAELDAMQR
jgi:tetratricopeptide (TPR) repeat protein